MPLRDLFRPPVSNRSSWEGFHGGWPMTIVQHLSRSLPKDFTAEPRVHLGPYFEIDVSTYKEDRHGLRQTDLDRGLEELATEAWPPPQPTLLVDADPSEQYEYEVLVYDQSRARQLVAAVEIVFPANKDRPESRRAIVSKCATLLRQGVCVSLVDLVTIRRFNLYTDLLAEFDRNDPAFAPMPPFIYAATCRGRKIGQKPKLEAWAHRLAIGEPLPTLPLWLTANLAISLDLETSYEETCRTLRIA